MIMFILLGVTLALLFIYITGKYNEGYWKKRGVTYHDKNKFFGPLLDYFRQDRAMFEIHHDIYRQYPNEPAVGIGAFLTPSLYVKDPLNVQHVLQSDFQSFNHRFVAPIEGDPLGDNILLMNGIKWRLMRQKMTPLFTAVKLKSMFYIMDKCSQEFVGFFDKKPEKLKGDAFETVRIFCSAAVGGAVFGINAAQMENSPFLKMIQTATALSPFRMFLFTISFINQELAVALGFKRFQQFESFFIPAVKEIIRQREKENVKGHDFADICVSLQKNGKIKDPETGFEMEPTDELLAAQAFFFFLAGVEPTATTIFNTLVEVGKSPGVMKKLLEEVDGTMDRLNGKLTYDAVSEMSYLEKVINESMRMHPGLGFLTRKCVRDSVLPTGNIKISKGTKITIPIFEFHHDPKFFPDPEVFDPERFSEHISEVYYMPFGKGNRFCIGNRYAMLQVKTALTRLLRNYTVKTIVGKGGVRYKKHPLVVRLSNVDVEFIPRKNSD